MGSIVQSWIFSHPQSFNTNASFFSSTTSISRTSFSITVIGNSRDPFNSTPSLSTKNLTDLSFSFSYEIVLSYKGKKNTILSGLEPPINSHLYWLNHYQQKAHHPPKPPHQCLLSYLRLLLLVVINASHQANISPHNFPSPLPLSIFNQNDSLSSGFPNPYSQHPSSSHWQGLITSTIKNEA